MNEQCAILVMIIITKYIVLSSIVLFSLVILYTVYIVKSDCVFTSNYTTFND